MSAIAPSHSFAREPFPIPELTQPVHDTVGILSSSTVSEMNQLLLTLNQSGIAQVAVLIVNSLGGLAPEEASLKVAEQWKLGDAKKDNGVLLLIAIADRKMRIEVGQGLEGVLTDARASRIIREWMRPQFQSGNFDSGVRFGVIAIVESIEPGALKSSGLQSTSQLREHLKSRKTLKELIFLLVIFVIGSFIFAKSFRHARVIPIGMGSRFPGHRGGFGTGGSGGFGGGFGRGYGGGGGGFSGGGASGGW